MDGLNFRLVRLAHLARADLTSGLPIRRQDLGAGNGR
jgi:hypothetical protein